jgi:hypothetical protein
VQGIIDRVKQRKNLVEASHLDRADHRPSVIDHDPQWLTPPLSSLGDVDQGLQTLRAQKRHLGQVNYQYFPVAELVEPGCDRGAEPIHGKQIDLPGHRHHQRLALSVHNSAGLDPHQLLARRTPTTAQIRIGTANT